MPGDGGPDGNIVKAIERLEFTLIEKIDGQTAAIERMERILDPKIDSSSRFTRGEVSAK